MRLVLVTRLSQLHIPSVPFCRRSNKRSSRPDERSAFKKFSLPFSAHIYPSDSFAVQWRWYSSFPSTTSKIKTIRKALLFSDQNNVLFPNCCTLMRILFWSRVCVFFFLILAVVFLELLQYSHWKSRPKHPAAKLDALVCRVVLSFVGLSLVLFQSLFSFFRARDNSSFSLLLLRRCVRSEIQRN